MIDHVRHLPVHSASAFLTAAFLVSIVGYIHVGQELAIFMR